MKNIPTYFIVVDKLPLEASIELEFIPSESEMGSPSEHDMVFSHTVKTFDLCDAPDIFSVLEKEFCKSDSGQIRLAHLSPETFHTISPQREGEISLLPCVIGIYHKYGETSLTLIENYEKALCLLIPVRSILGPDLRPYAALVHTIDCK